MKNHWNTLIIWKDLWFCNTARGWNQENYAMRDGALFVNPKGNSKNSPQQVHRSTNTYFEPTSRLQFGMHRTFPYNQRLIQLWMSGGMLQKFRKEAAPTSIIELTRCVNCKSGCNSNNSSCLKQGLSRISICWCSDCCNLDVLGTDTVIENEVESNVDCYAV